MGEGEGEGEREGDVILSDPPSKIHIYPFLSFFFISLFLSTAFL